MRRVADQTVKIGQHHRVGHRLGLALGHRLGLGLGHRLGPAPGGSSPAGDP